jgi:hypothetical protein
MQWNKPECRPKNKSTSYSRFFAFLPTRVDDGRKVWLEWVYTEYEYDSEYESIWDPKHCWVVTARLTKDQWLKRNGIKE